MDCKGHIQDLLPDFLLGQLAPDEEEEVRLHLAEHAACREALEEVAGVLDLMPLAVPPAPPPAGLKERAIARALAPPVEGAPQEGAQRPAGGPERRRSRTPAFVAAAAVLLVLSSVGFSYLSLERENDRLQAEVRQLQQEVGGGGLVVLAVEGTGRAPEARGTAVLDASEGALALDVYNLPAPPEGRSYRAWLLEPGGGTVALGEMKTDGRGDGRMTGRVSGSLNAYEALQITLEPDAGDDLSGPVLMEARL